MEKSSILFFNSCGRDWSFTRPSDLESLWKALDSDAFQADERLPYWVELWPSSFALAGLITNNAACVKGKICLDIGCGLGFTALVGVLSGGHVIAMDYEPMALRYAYKNAEMNKVTHPLWMVMDWRFPALKAGVCDIIWAGDIMYEKRFIVPVLEFIEHSLAPDGVMWLAEPGRNVYGDFNNALHDKGWTSSRLLRENVRALDGIKITVNIWEIRKNKK